MSVVILIIAHKPKLDIFEARSLRQCFSILGDFPIVLVCPSGLDVSEYKTIASQAEFCFIDPKWQSDYMMFNRLKISPLLYEMFASFDYVLFYELVSWVFGDELNYWCNPGYDYIGAPWVNMNIYKWLFHKKKKYPPEIKWVHWLTQGKKLKLVGNGGLSLRNTKSMISNLKLFSFRARNWSAHEDSFISHYIGTFNSRLKIPDVETALQFSFDVYPEKAFELNHDRLPFGCHAFYRSDELYYSRNVDFWSRFIDLKT